MSETRDVVIIGSGCSGHTAALYTARANLKPLVIEGHEPGGQLSMTTLVENFPGFPEGILGPQLVENMRKQAERFGAEYRMAHLTSADLGKRPFLLHIGVHQVHAQTLIIASGASARWLGLPHEQQLIGHGVSSCATCDGFFFRGQDIAVVGGGDSALEEALFLTRFATSVTVIHRRDALRASKIMQERAFSNEKIRFAWNTQVVEVLGDDKVTGLKVRDTLTKEDRVLEVTGVFVAIGHVPNTTLVTGQVDLHANGYVRTGLGSFTNIEGLFAAGDVQDDVYRQAVTSAGSGCIAAIDAERWLETLGM